MCHNLQKCGSCCKHFCSLLRDTLNKYQIRYNFEHMDVVSGGTDCPTNSNKHTKSQLEIIFFKIFADFHKKSFIFNLHS